MNKLIELKQFLKNYVDSITRFPTLNFKVVSDIIEYNTSIIEMKMELRRELSQFYQLFDVDCVYVKKIDVPIPNVIHLINLGGLSHVIIHYDNYLKMIKRFDEHYPKSSFNRNMVDGLAKFTITNFSFNNNTLVEKLNFKLHVSFIATNRHMLDLRPFIKVGLFSFGDIVYESPKRIPVTL